MTFWQHVNKLTDLGAQLNTHQRQPSLPSVCMSMTQVVESDTKQCTLGCINTSTSCIRLQKHGVPADVNVFFRGRTPHGKADGYLQELDMMLQGSNPYLSGHASGLPVWLGLFHSFANLLHLLIQFHGGLNQDGTKPLPRVLQRSKEKKRVKLCCNVLF